jgi:membrane protease subunit HflK
MIRKTFWALLAVGIVGYLLTGVVEVREGERGVVRRFGRVIDPPLEPGLSVGLPWGMQRVDRVPVDRVRTITLGYEEAAAFNQLLPPGQLLTGDHNLVNVQVVLQYKVDAGHVVDYVVHADRVEALLTRAAESALSAWVASREVDYVLLEGKDELRDELVREVRDRTAPYQLGVQVLGARVALVAPPDEVKDEFDNVMKAQTGMVTARHKATQDAERKERLAQAEVYAIEQETAAYVEARTLLAREDARRFTARLEQYRKGLESNPQYLRQVWEEERGKLFAKLKQGGRIDLLDHHLGPGGLDIITAPKMQENK